MTHSHNHAAPPGASDGSVPTHRTRLWAAFAVTVTLMVAQLAGTVLTGSLALLADTGHMLTDAVGLAIALIAAHLVTRPATTRRTWGLRRAEVLAAFTQAALLAGVSVFVIIEGVSRLISPPEVPSTELVIFGIIGLVGNVVSLAVLSGGRGASFNLRAAFLEVLNDALGSIGVIAAALVIAWTGWQRADAIAALLIGCLMLPRAASLLRSTGEVLLESAPPGLDLQEVRHHLEQADHVLGVHDLHASLIATGLPTLSAHVVVADECFYDGHAPAILDSLQACVATHFDPPVVHTTFQLEPTAHASHEHGAHA